MANWPFCFVVVCLFACLFVFSSHGDELSVLFCCCWFQFTVTVMNCPLCFVVVVVGFSLQSR